MFIASTGIVEEISESEYKKIKKHDLQEIHAAIRALLQAGHQKREHLEKVYWWGTFADIDHFFTMHPKENKMSLMECLFMTWQRLHHFTKHVDLLRGEEEYFDDGDFDCELERIAKMLFEKTRWNPYWRYVSKNDPNIKIY